MKTCDDCVHFETGMSASDVSGVCVLHTDWSAHSLWWQAFYDAACPEFEQDPYTAVSDDDDEK